MEKEIEKKLQEYIKTNIKILEDTGEQLSKHKTIIIDKKYFDNKFVNDVDVSECFKEFKELKNIKKPVLYWFELASFENNEGIRKEYIGYREPMKKDYANKNYRNTSSYKTKYEPKSETLYVGKVEKGFWGRLVTHLGYNSSVKTAGMQLYHWYNPETYGDIKLSYIVFEPEMKYLVLMLEKQLAKDLKPLIGKY